MWHTRRGGLAIVLMVALAAGCAGPGATSGPTERAQVSPRSETPGPTATPGISGLAIAAVDRIEADPADAGRAATAVNDVGFDLLRAATHPNDNAVLSPASIVLALAMARPGARGETATEMDEVMRDVASDEHAAWLNALEAALAARSGTFQDAQDKNADVLLRIVNAPFAQSDYDWQPAYLDALASRFGAGVRLVDYINDAEAVRLTINAWVDEQTERRIPELLEQGIVDDLTRIVLVNAVYLKAAWQAPFEKERTKPGAFRLLDGSTVSVPMMHRSYAPVGFASGEGWIAVDIPYVGKQLSMTIVVPDDLLEFQQGLDAATFSIIVDALESGSVLLTMPKFAVESKLELREALAAMGMPSAFDDRRADFSGMTLEERLIIKAVVHQANIDVDEEGTEAAASTAVIGGVVSLPPSVVVDRPFLFALRDRATGTILFLGRVVEPEVGD
jgi:serpin B